jgi:succinate dehydrogenase cytochrome b556 subunit
MRKETLEIWSWFLQRVSAVFLVIGLLVHFWVLHYINIDEKPITFSIVQQRLQSPLWIAFDSLLLLAVVYHALNGIWSIFLDWNPRKSIRKILGWSLSVVGVVSFVLGIYILFPFSG